MQQTMNTRHCQYLWVSEFSSYKSKLQNVLAKRQHNQEDRHYEKEIKYSWFMVQVGLYLTPKINKHTSYHAYVDLSFED